MRLILPVAAAFFLASAALSEASSADIVSHDIRDIVEMSGSALSNALTQAALKHIDPSFRILGAEEVSALEKSAAPIARAEAWPRGILFVDLQAVSKGAYQGVVDAINSFTNSDMSGLVLDLRGAGGWDLDESEKIASLFLTEGTPICRIVTSEGQRRRGVRASGGAPVAGRAVTVILVDKETSGLAEMLAGTLSGRRNIVLMGAATSGTSALQEILPLKNGQYLFIRTGWVDWGRGVKAAAEPDIVVQDDGNDSAVPAPPRVGHQSADLIRLLELTAEDEVIRRASDLILARARVTKRTEDAGKNPED